MSSNFKTVSPLLAQKLNLKNQNPLLPEAPTEADLRRFKYQKMIRLVEQTLAHPGDFEPIGRFWSDTADQLIEAAFQMALRQLPLALPSPTRGEGNQIEMAVIALGKLGSQELNLSSDIDLLFVYQNAGDSDQTPQKIARLVTQILSRITPEGFVFRVDNDLRPEGSKGALAFSIESAERYYESRGADWERMALIRARYVAGSPSLGKAFLEMVRPFIYRKHWTLENLQGLKEIKAQMALQAQHGVRGRDNIKAGRGGIREIEFIVQTLQLLYGGATKALRQHNTFGAIRSLSQNHLIPKRTAQALTEGYHFLRLLENGLQMAEDRQTHSLPSEENDAEWERLALVLGISKIAKLKYDLENHRQKIGRLFDGLFESDYEKFFLEEAIRSNTASATSEEEKLEGLSWFKRQESQRILQLDLAQKIPFPEVLRRLTLVAEVTLQEAYRLTADGVTSQVGILGLGRMGSHEMDYNSDLDLIFLYPETESGHATAFTRFAQKLIARLGTRTRYGRAYLIDCELRPSGGAGVLVSSIEAFRRYHTESAELWERFALAKARPVAGPKSFFQQCPALLNTLVYERPLPKNAAAYFKNLHDKMIRELAKESPGRYNLKEGPGGTVMIEAVLQLLQLTRGDTLLALRQTGSFETLSALIHAGILPEEDGIFLNESLLTLRRVVAHNRVLTNSPTSWLEMENPAADKLAVILGHTSKQTMESGLQTLRQGVCNIYGRYFGG